MNLSFGKLVRETETSRTRKINYTETDHIKTPENDQEITGNKVLQYWIIILEQQER